MKKNRRMTRRLVVLAMLAAISVVLVYFIHFPIFTAFLEYDPADIPILIGTFAYGPVWGLILTVVASAVQAMTVSSASGWMGFLMHVIATGSMAVVSGCIYKKKHTKKGAILALGIGALTMVIVMIPLNLIITPIFTQSTAADVAMMLVPTIIPFNVVKAGINVIVTFLLYKRVSKIIHRGEEIE